MWTNKHVTAVPGEVEVIAVGFEPGTDVEIWLAGVLLAKVTADVDGGVDAIVAIPAGIPVGTYPISTHGLYPNGAPLVMAKALAIVSPVIDPPATDTATRLTAQSTSTTGLIVVFASLFLVLAAGLTFAPSHRLATPLAPSTTVPSSRRRSGRARRSQR